jgi:hypothetical protein
MSDRKLRIILFVSFSTVALLISLRVRDPPSLISCLKSVIVGKARNSINGIPISLFCGFKLYSFAAFLRIRRSETCSAI